jgi:phage repressor protein C with HTH and peptisase S24 domain
MSVAARAELGKSETQLRRYETGSEIPFTVIATLAREAELPIEWLATGEPGDGEPTAFLEDIAVQKLAFTASAGSGSLAIDDHAAKLPFPRSVLDRVNVKAANARVLEASGESMKSTINDGDLLLVDISDNTIAEGKVYVFSIGDEVFVKRLRRTGERIMVRADNQDLFPGEEPVPSGIPFRVYGRVKWAGRNL